MDLSASAAIYILFAIILFQFLTIVLLAYFYEKKTKVLDAREQDKTKAFTYIVDKANTKASEIIENAVDKAGNFVHDAQDFKVKIEHEAKHVFTDSLIQHKKSFEDMFQETLTEYRTVLADMKETLEKKVDANVDDLEKFAQAEIGEIKADTIEKNQKLEAYMKQKIDAELAQAKNQIELYKQQEFQRTSQVIHDQIIKVTRDVLHLSIPREQHEKLILDALERAKKESFFNS